jgi:CRP-like cAMP-binding protein
VPSDNLLHSLEAASSVRDIGQGELLFEQGAPAEAIFSVENGRLRLIRRTIDDHLIVLHTARPGELFAEASLFAEAYHCDAVAAVSSRVRAYPKTSVLEALRHNPALAEAFIARLAQQLQELRGRMELRNIGSARERVLQYLRLRAGALSRSVALEGQLQDIAAEIGVSRETLYRTLAALEDEGQLARSGSAILLKKTDNL